MRTRISIVLAAFALALALPMATFATQPHPEHKVGICHRTASDTNPYVYIEVDEAAVDTHLHNGQGHPPKTNPDGSPRNDYLAPNGASDCEVPSSTATPTPTGTPSATATPPEPTPTPTPTTVPSEEPSPTPTSTPTPSEPVPSTTPPTEPPATPNRTLPPTDTVRDSDPVVLTWSQGIMFTLAFLVTLVGVLQHLEQTRKGRKQ
jgi:outer membrane biosynthesis protein TonB